ncbi:MAG: SDR family oxidoreductase [Variovorax sp.]|nr:SDR family oxidoreductase [Variovorax sp.]
MQQLVKDKVVVVTGAGGGIGRAIAIAMAAGGAKVVVNDIGTGLRGEGRDAGAAGQVVDEIKARGGIAVANSDSVADAASAERIVESAVNAFGRIDCVVNNAGILRDGIFHKMSVADWEAVIQVHLNGAFHTSKAASAFFKEQNAGCLVHMTSTSGLIGNMGQANYSAAKLGIVALSKSIAIDMARFNVRSNCISPFAWSRMTSSVPTDTPEKLARVERNRQMTPDKIAPLSVFLASDEARDVNAQVFAVRNNEIFVMSQPRPIRSVHRGEGWTPETIRDHAMPALRRSLVPVETSGQVFCWDPV